MSRYQRWFGWIAIGFSAVALLVALGARGLGPQIAAGMGATNARQAYTQSDNSAQQRGGQRGAPQGSFQGGNVQPNTNQQPTGPQSNAQAPRGGQRGSNQSQGAGNAGADWRGAGRAGNAGIGRGGWFSHMKGWLGGAFRTGLLALLVVIGGWLVLRGGRTNAASSSQAAPTPVPTPAPQQTSPTGEAYIDTPDDHA